MCCIQKYVNKMEKVPKIKKNLQSRISESKKAVYE